jgi:hypothetical protein
LGRSCLFSRLPVSDDAFTRSRVVTAASHHRDLACASTFVTRDRPAQPNQSADAGTASESVTTGLFPGLLFAGPGTSPEVSSPSAHVSRVARSLRRRPASGRSRSGVSRSPRPRYWTRTFVRRRVALAVFRSFSGIESGNAPDGGRLGPVVRSFRKRVRTGVYAAPGRAFDDREDLAIPSSSRSIVQVTPVKPACSRSRRTRPIEPCRLRSRRPSRVMHRRVL